MNYSNNIMVPDALKLIGGCYQELKEYSTAIAYYQQALLKHPIKEEELYYKIAVCNIMLYDYNSAVNAFQIIVDSFA